MSHLQIALLGPPQVQHAALPITFSTRKELALLAYLAVEQRVHLRKNLTERLWPESDEVHGRAAFRITLSRLRDALGEGTTSSKDAHLLVEGTSLSLKQADLTLDLQIVETACALAHRLSTGKRERSVEYQHEYLHELEQATCLVRGSFLQGFSLRDAPPFEDWMRSQQAYWQVRLRLLFDQLAALHEDRQDYDQALETTQKWLDVDPLHEEGYLRLMHIYELRGDRRAALQAYEMYRALLERELHAVPSPSITALAQRLRQASPSPTQPERRASSDSPPSSMSLLHTPLIGRDTEFITLLERYGRMQQTTEVMQVVLIEGEAGIGKTRLAQEFLHWAQEQGADVLHGRAFEMGGRLPYQPLITALRPRLDAENAPDDLLADVWLAELSRILPELRERYPDLSAPAQDEGGSHLFEAVARLIQSWAQRRPLVLFLDDLHWADTASLDLILYLAGSWSQNSGQVVLLLALRSEALHRPSPLQHWKTVLDHTVALTHLPLSSLTARQTHEVILALAGEAPHDTTRQVGHWLYQQTSGQPFYLLETLKLLLERKAIGIQHTLDGSWTLDFTDTLRAQDGQTSLLPGSVRRLIQARLAALSPVATMFLLASAVLDQQASFEGMCVVAEVSESEGLLLLNNLLEQRFLIERKPEVLQERETVYPFAHDKIREVIYDEASAAHRRVFHRHAFELLQRTGATAADLAHHAHAAMHSQAAFHYSVQAGDDALTVFALSDALEHYEQAMALLSVHTQTHMQTHMQTDLFSLTSQFHLYEQAGRTYELVNAWSQAGQIYHILLALAHKAGNQQMEWTALHHLTTVGTGLVLLPGEAKGLLEANQQQSLQSSSGKRLSGVQGSESFTWSPKDMWTYATRALQLARDLQEKELIALSANSLGIASLYLGNWSEAVTAAEEAFALFIELGDRWLQAEVLGLICNALCFAGRPHEAITRGRELLALARALESEYTIASSTMGLVWSLVETGEYFEALTLATRAVAISHALNSKPYEFLNLWVLGDVYLALFQLQEAQETFSRCLAVMPFSIYQGEIHARLCAIAGLLGAWDEAYAYAQKVEGTRDELALPISYIFYWSETEALVRHGELGRAEEGLRTFNARVRTNNRFSLAYFRSQVVVSLYKSEYEQAISYLHEAAQRAQYIGLPGERWQILAALGAVYETIADHEHAQEAFAQAAAIVQELASRIDDEAMRAHFLAAFHVQQVTKRECKDLAT